MRIPRPPVGHCISLIDPYFLYSAPRPLRKSRYPYTSTDTRPLRLSRPQCIFKVKFRNQWMAIHVEQVHKIQAVFVVVCVLTRISWRNKPSTRIAKKVIKLFLKSNANIQFKLQTIPNLIGRRKRIIIVNINLKQLLKLHNFFTSNLINYY